MSVRNYHYSLRNDPEERSSQLLRGGSLKSRNIAINQISYSLPLDEYNRHVQIPADFAMKPVYINISVGHCTITLRE
jgi:hypothetical protein